MKYKVTIAEGIGYRQFVGFVEAETEKEARQKGREEFEKEKPLCSAKYKIIMVSKVREY